MWSPIVRTLAVILIAGGIALALSAGFGTHSVRQIGLGLTLLAWDILGKQAKPYRRSAVILLICTTSTTLCVMEKSYDFFFWAGIVGIIWGIFGLLLASPLFTQPQKK